MMETAICRSCGAPIIWCKTAAGKTMPVDAKACPDGNLIREGASVRYRNREEMASNFLADPRYKSHFATCANAAQHRKSKK
jgi:hypothetical protein